MDGWIDVPLGNPYARYIDYWIPAIGLMSLSL